MNVDELDEDIHFVIHTSMDLAITAGLLESADIPLYALGGALLTVAGFAEQVRVRSLEAYAECQQMRGVSESVAGLPDEKTLAAVRRAVAAVRSARPEAEDGDAG